MGAKPVAMPVTPTTAPAASAAPQPVSSQITGAIQRAAQATGASFEYLLATAKVESNFNPGVTARGSSATGLFQFVEQTWLGLMRETGRALGLGNYADAISRDSSGRYQVADARLRNEILRLRTDPSANAAMAGIFTRRNANQVGQRIGRPPTNAELYMAHFFGSSGASRIINAARTDPSANAAAMFPSAARANRSVFYDRQGRARSVAGVQSELQRRYQVAQANVAPMAMAVAQASPQPSFVRPAQGSRQVPDTAGTNSVLAAAGPASPPASQPTFRSLFQTDETRGAVAPVVSELWGRRPPGATPVSPIALADPLTTTSGAQLDLFRDQAPDVRRLFGGNRGA
jgi:hypothetical protein